MTPAVSRLLQWAAVIGAGLALTLTAWQGPALADGANRALAAGPSARLRVATSLGALTGIGLVYAGRRRPPRTSRRPAPCRPISVSRPPGRRRSRR